MLDLKAQPFVYHDVNASLSGGREFKVSRQSGGLCGQSVIFALALVLVRHRCATADNKILAAFSGLMDAMQPVTIAGVMPQIQQCLALAAAERVAVN